MTFLKLSGIKIKNAKYRNYIYKRITILLFFGVCKYAFNLFSLLNSVLVRYVEQLVASAEAAVEEVIRRGVSNYFFP